MDRLSRLQRLAPRRRVEQALGERVEARARALTPDALHAHARPFDEERWSCTASRDRVEFRAARMLGREESLAFDRAQFLVAGKLPAPAL